MAKKDEQSTKDSAPVAEKKTVKKVSKNKMDTTKAVIMGIGNLAVIASITYSAAVIVLGTEGLVPLILISPMVVFALVKLIKQFIK